MSHEATSWAVKQRGLKPAAKIVLWHLADRHHPDYGCFPSQARLAEDAEMSRSTLNVHLAELEAAGLIRRVRAIDERTKRQKSTRYILAFESTDPQGVAQPCPDFGHGTEAEQAEKPCPVSGHGAVSDFGAEPCPENGKSRVRISDTNLVSEPLREPVTRDAREGGVLDRFSEFWATYPQPEGESAARRAWKRVATPENAEAIIAAARAYQDDDRVKRGFAKMPANWLLDRCWQEAKASSERRPVDLDALSDMWAPKVASGAFVPPSAISPALARHMLGKGLVSRDDLRRCGVTA